ncbi:MAG: glycosyltransferase family 9 protein, partial [bacterium]
MIHCILQWARLGDLFQTRPLLARIRANDPAAEILLCVDEIFAELATSFPEPDRVVGMPLRHFWALAKFEHRLDTLFAEFQQVLQKANFARPDIVYVLNQSRAATHFAGMLQAKETRGFVGRKGAPDPPMAYLDNMVSDPTATPAHLTDLWALLAGPPEASPDFPPSLAAQFPPSLPCSARRLGIFVGAGDPARAWPEENWIELLKLLKGALQEVLLLGTERDTPAARRMETLCQELALPVRNFVAQTTLPALGSILASCNLIISSDTGGLHFAAALGIPTLGLFFSGARAAFTGPCAPCAHVLESEEFIPEGRMPSPKDVAHAVSVMFAESVETPPELSSGLALRSPCLDDFGLLYQSPAERNRVLPKKRAELWRTLAPPLNETSHFNENRPLLSIIIPTAGQWHLTRECLQAISPECHELAPEILVVTGEPPAGDFSRASELGGVKIVLADGGRAFAELCNGGARESSGEYLLFLNNDTLPEPGFLKSLLDTYARHSPCILSPLLLYWDGLVQNAGIRLGKARIEEIGHGTWPEQESGVSQCDAVSATAMLVSKEIFENLSGFDEGYINGYEDLDFCLRAREKGIPSLLDFGSRVRHFRGATPGRYQNEDQNRKRFEERWMPRGIQANSDEATPAFSLEPPLQFRNRPLPLVCVLCSEDWQAAGSRVRWAGPLARLQNEGFLRAQWHCVNSNAEIWERLEKDFASSALVILRRPLCNPADHERLLELLSRVEIPFLIDVDDLFFGQFSPLSSRGQRRRALEESFCELLQRAEVVTASTAPLGALYRQYHSEIVMLPNTVDTLWWPQARSERTISDTFTIGFFGSPAHGIDLASVAPA